MIKSFDVGVVESLSKVLGDTAEGFTGSQISGLLREANFPDPLAGVTKWRRLNQSFLDKQSADKCANNIGAFIENAMSPARHYDNQDWYVTTKHKINQILSFEGLYLGDDGKLKKVEQVQTALSWEKEVAEAPCKVANGRRHPFDVG